VWKKSEKARVGDNKTKQKVDNINTDLLFLLVSEVATLYPYTSDDVNDAQKRWAEMTHFVNSFYYFFLILFFLLQRPFATVHCFWLHYVK
jgi:hypothetical protein